MSLRIGNRVRHHTNEQVADMVRDTLTIADDVTLNEDDRALLLPEIFRVVANHHLEIEQVDARILGGRLGQG